MNQIEKLVQQFSENVVAQADSIRAGDWKGGNKFAKKYIDAFDRLRTLGEEGRDGLVPLLNGSQDEVRAMAAAFLLRHRHDLAKRVLEELASGNGPMAFSAGETLKRWSEGTWALDPV